MKEEKIMKGKIETNERLPLLSRNTSTKNWHSFFKPVKAFIKPAMFVTNFLASLLLPALATVLSSDSDVKNAFLKGFSQGQKDALSNNGNSLILAKFSNIVFDYDPKPGSALSLMMVLTCALDLGGTSYTFYHAGKTAQKRYHIAAAVFTFISIAQLLATYYMFHPGDKTSYFLGYREGFCGEKIQQNFCEQFAIPMNKNQDLINQILELHPNLPARIASIAASIATNVVSLLSSYYAGKQVRREISEVNDIELNENQSITKAP